MEHWTHWVIGMVGAYVVGSLPFGVWIARAKGVNILEVGSGNIGATNVARALGKGPGAAVFALDVLKGAVPAGIGLWASSGNSLFATIIGLAAILGHTASPFLRFRGGKGVATGLGMLLASVPLVAVSGLGVFVVAFGVWRMVSLASILAALSLLLFGVLWATPTAVLVIHTVLVAYVVYRHRANIRRILEGTEPKFAPKKKLEAPDPPEPGSQERPGG